ncbi:NUDIX domain-containing protein [Azospirillum sp. sgz302134]
MPHDTGNPWTVLTTKPMYENPWMKVVEYDVLKPNGKPGIYGVMHTKSVATGIVPIDDDGCVILVGQYRFALHQYSWEIPEGGGRKDVDPLISAQRELEEETGQMARHWLPILHMSLSNSITDEVAYGFLAWGLEQGTADPDDTEVLQLRRVPFAEAYDMVRRGTITDAIAVACLMKVRLLALEGELPEDVTRLILG